MLYDWVNVFLGALAVAPIWRNIALYFELRSYTYKQLNLNWRSSGCCRFEYFVMNLKWLTHDFHFIYQAADQVQSKRVLKSAKNP